MLKRLIFAILLCFAVSPIFASGMQDKKIIEYGWDVPNTAYVREHVAEMEKMPLDGVVIRIDLKHITAGWGTFSRVKFNPEEIEQPIADLKAIKSKKLTDNFVQMTVSPGDVDWFDADWSTVLYNVGWMAKIAKEGGCKGIMFDPEVYGKSIWAYSKYPEELRSKHSFEEYAAQVKKCGKEFIQAINKEYPDITLFCLYATSLAYVQTPVGDYKNAEYGLLKYFFDGVCEAAAPKTTVIDGFELSYGYRNLSEFVDGRRTMLRHGRDIAENKKEYDEHMRAGFGLWMDNGSLALGWSQVDFPKNYFTPAGFRASLNYALTLSDKYVWIYTERTAWWSPNPNIPIAPQAYIDAIINARKGPGPGEKKPRPLLDAAKVPGYSDADTFAELKKTMTEVMDFPKDTWKWTSDKMKAGLRWGYAKPEFDDSKWRSISIGKFWEEQGEENCDGFGWYRIKFKAPKIESGKRVFLVLGAADDACSVWFNGELMGSQNIAWNTVFTLEVTDYIKLGLDNVLAVRVLDKGGVGGLWKSVKLMVK